MTNPEADERTARPINGKPRERDTDMENAHDEAHTGRRALTLLASVALLLVGAAACDLDVQDPQNVTASDRESFTPEQAVELTINGFIDRGQEYQDNWVLNTGLFTDEFLLAGTFPTREQIDERNILRTNGTLQAEVYDNLQGAIFAADTAITFLEANLGTQRFSDLQGTMEDGIARAKFWGGMLRLYMAEGFCQAVEDAGPLISSEEMAGRALSQLQAAESDASSFGLSDIATAARVGQARAHMFRREFGAARSLVTDIPAEHVFNAIYATDINANFNEVHALTHGTAGEVVRWAVGGGDVPQRFSEEWPYFDQWVSLGFITPNSDLDPFNTNFQIPVHLQNKYASGADPLPVTSGVEADFIEAELELRDGNTGAAESIVNPYRADHGLGDMSFTGDLQQDLELLARERAREMWITGRRMGFLRRILEDGVDLFPEKEPGVDWMTCFPIPQNEFDANPNL